MLLVRVLKSIPLIVALVLLVQMMFPWMFDEIHALRPFKDAAYLLAEEEDWPPLYDIATLNSNQVCSIIRSCRSYILIS